MGRLYHSARTVYDVSLLCHVGVRVQEIELVLRVHDIVPHATADGDDDDAVVDGDHDAGCNDDHDAAGADDDGDDDHDTAGGDGYDEMVLMMMMQVAMVLS